MNPLAKIKFTLITGACGLLLALSNWPAKADDASEIQALKKQLEALEQKVQSLEPRQEMDWTNRVCAAKNVPIISLGAGGFKMVSADTNFMMNIRGYMQLDSRTFLGIVQPGADGFILRRVHPIIAGTVFHDFSYQFMAEFAGNSSSIYDAYVNYHPMPEIQLEVGRFKTPFGLEWLQSATKLAFNERSLATDLVPLRDVGLQLHGNLFAGRMNYAAGIFNSVADGSSAGNSDFDNEPEFIGRVFLEPFKHAHKNALMGLGFGVGGSYGRQFSTSAVTSGYKTDGRQKFFTYSSEVAGNGAHWRISPQAYYYYGPLSLLGEYVISDQQVRNGPATAELQNNAWEVSGGWVITGERSSYAGVTPQHPFNPLDGGWGAWQLVARFAGLNVDDNAFPTFANLSTSASSAAEWAVGLNWWLNKNVRFMTSFSRTTFTGGAAGTVTQKPEEVLFTRIQLAF